jgi:hypothetical protein
LNMVNSMTWSGQNRLKKYEKTWLTLPTHVLRIHFYEYCGATTIIKTLSVTALRITTLGIMIFSLAILSIRILKSNKYFNKHHYKKKCFLSLASIE